jgi:hypothetical protein
MIGILTRPRGMETQRHTGRTLENKECQGLSAANRHWENPPFEPAEGQDPDNTLITLISDLQPPEQCESQFLSF